MQPVLLIDDDPSTRELVAACLEHDGIPVVTASNGKEGLDRLTFEKPSLILLDLEMPVMDGEQFRRAQLRDSRLSRIPTILLTAAQSAVQRARELGVGLFRKPFDLDDLVWVVRSMMRRAQTEGPLPQH